MSTSGISSETLDFNSLTRDPRTPWRKFKDAAAGKQVSLAVIAISLVISFLFPSLYFVSLITGGVFYVRASRVKLELPFNLPIYSNTKDPSLVVTGTFRDKLEDAAGVGLLGYDLETREQIWTTIDKYLTHLLVLGETGVGKSVTMLGHAFTFMMVGGGVTYNDAKGTIELVHQMYTLSRYFGLDDNFRALNYLTGNSSESRDPTLRRSNDFNIYATGGHDGLTQYTISLLGEVGKGDNKVFEGQAMGLVASVMPALVELRDKNLLHLNPGVLRRFIEFPIFTALSENPHISDRSRASLQAFTASLSGYNPALPLSRQDPQVMKQFGFAQAYLQRQLSLLTDTYGHIFMVGHPEMDARDIVFKNRICVTLLPSMEKSSGELGSLATGVLASIRGAMSLGLGDRLEGSRSETVSNGLGATKIPTLIINDEYAYMAVKDFAVTAAQARGLKFCIIFGTQDYAGMKRVDAGEAEQIIENTVIKQIMRGQMTGDTLSLIQQLVGKKTITKVSGLERRSSGMQAFKEAPRLEFSEVDRVSGHDIRGLEQGEAFLVVGNSLIKSQVFFHGFTGSDWVENFEIMRLLKIDLPKRGAGASLFMPGMNEAQSGALQWLRNTTEEDVSRYVNASTFPKKLSSLITSVFDDNLSGSPTDKALSLLANYDVTDRSGGKLPPSDVGGDDGAVSIDDGDSDGPLQNSSGNAFRFDDGDSDITEASTRPEPEPEPEPSADTLDAADDERRKGSSMLDSLSDIGMDSYSKGEEEDIESITDASDYLPQNRVSIIKGLSEEVQDIENIVSKAELSGGASADVARARAKKTGSIIAKSVLHPIPPNPPDNPDANREIVDEYVAQWLANDGGDDDI